MAEAAENAERTQIGAAAIGGSPVSSIGADQSTSEWAMDASRGDDSTHLCAIMQEVAVETFGVMAKTEKIAFILEQVRLCLKKEDFIRAFILVKKITPRAFTEKRLVSDGKSEGGEKKEMAMDGPLCHSAPETVGG